MLRVLSEAPYIVLNGGRPGRMAVCGSKRPRDRQGVSLRFGESETIEHGLPGIREFGPDICRCCRKLAYNARKSRIERVAVQGMKASRVMMELIDLGGYA